MIFTCFFYINNPPCESDPQKQRKSESFHKKNFQPLSNPAQEETNKHDYPRKSRLPAQNPGSAAHGNQEAAVAPVRLWPRRVPFPAASPCSQVWIVLSRRYFYSISNQRNKKHLGTHGFSSSDSLFFLKPKKCESQERNLHAS